LNARGTGGARQGPGGDRGMEARGEGETGREGRGTRFFFI